VLPMARWPSARQNSFASMSFSLDPAVGPDMSVRVVAHCRRRPTLLRLQGPYAIPRDRATTYAVIARFRRATHMWTAPHLQELGSVRTGSLAIICPVSAIGHDRWPRWFPRHEFQTVTRYRIPLGRTECLTSWDRSTTPSAPSLASSGLSESRCSSPAELVMG
jgi:hypothetical protein